MARTPRGNQAAPKSSSNSKATAKADEAAQPDAADRAAAASEPAAAEEMTPAEAAACVKRPLTRIGKDGQPVLDDEGAEVFDLVEVEAHEVFAHSVRGDEVTVVTTDGHKLKGEVA